MAGWGRRLWRWTAGIAAGVIIVLALLVGVFRLVMTQLPDYKVQIQGWASEAVGLPVNIGSIDARWRLAGPELFFTQAEILSSDGADVLLKAGEGSVSLDLGELISRGRIAPGRVTLSGIQIDVLRDEQGRIQFLGRAASRPEGDQPEVRLPYGQFLITDSVVLWEDRLLGAPEREFTDVRLMVSHDRKALRVEGYVTLPAGLGQDAEFWVQGTPRPGRRDEFSWTGFGSLDGFQLETLSALDVEVPLPRSGITDLRFWITRDSGRLESLIFEVDADNLVLESLDGQGTVSYEQMSGRAEWERRSGGWSAHVEDLLVRRRGLAWRSSRSAVEFAQNPGGGATVYVDSDLARVEDIVPLAALVPGESLRSALAATAPRGDIENLVAQVRLPPPAAESPAAAEVDGEAPAAPGEEGADADPGADQPGIEVLEIEADFAGLGIDAVNKRPGASGLTGRVRASSRDGRVTLTGADGVLELPGIFRGPLPLQEAEGAVTWRRSGGALHAVGEGLVLGNRDLRLEADFELDVDEGGPHMSLRGTVVNVDIGAVSTYLPVAVIPPGVVTWLDGALVAGRVPSASVVLEGPLRKFPFVNDEGRFDIRMPVEDMTFRYAGDWPVATGVSAEVRFLQESLFARITEGDLNGVQVGEFAVDIPRLGRAEITIDGWAEGSAANMHAYGMASPVREMLGPALVDTEARAGDVRLDLGLFLPVANLAEYTVEGLFTLSDVEIVYGTLPPLSRLNGAVHVFGDEVTCDAMTGAFLGEQVNIRITPGAEGAIDAVMGGQFDSPDLAVAFDLPVLGVVSGRTDWRLDTHFPGRTPGDSFGLRASTDMIGATVHLPEPFGKEPDVARDVDVRLSTPQDGKQRWEMAYDDLVKAALVFTSGDDLVFDRGLVAVGRGVDRPRLRAGTGLHVLASLDTFELDPWLDVELQTGDGRLEQVLAGGEIDIRTAVLPGQTLFDVDVEFSRGDGAWQVRGRADALEGTAKVPYRFYGPDPLEFDLTRLSLFPETPEADIPPEGYADGSLAPNGVSADGAAADLPSVAMEPIPGTDPLSRVEVGVDPRIFPAMRGTIGEFVFSDFRLGQAEVEIARLDDGVEITRMVTTAPSFDISVLARAVSGEDGTPSNVTVRVDSRDVGDTLAYMGYESGIDAQKGRFEFSLDWLGPIPEDFLGTVQGEATVRIEQGTLNEVSPGAGRVFGLLTVQALPRRLTLDFRDVFEKGFAFDVVEGDFVVSNGSAFTRNLHLESAAAEVAILGRAGLVARDYDQTAVVRADVGGALPLAGVIAGGPAVGAGIWFLNEMFRRPLKGLAQITYRITGSWDDPLIEQVRRSDQSAMIDGAPAAGGG